MRITGRTRLAGIMGWPVAQPNTLADDAARLLGHLGDGLLHRPFTGSCHCLRQLPFEANRRRGAGSDGASAP